MMKAIARHARHVLAPWSKTALLRSGAYDLLRRVRPSHHLAILRYHAICEPHTCKYADPSICVSPRAFEEQLRYLTSRYTVVRLPDAVRALTQHLRFPENAVALTFDDGYADNLEAARLLHRFGVSATFYITAGCLAEGHPFWPVELRWLLARIRDPQLQLSTAGHTIRLPCATVTQQSAAVRHLTQVFKANPISVREELRQQLRTLSDHLDAPRVMLTWDEVREMHRLGMTIGAHTMTHPNLPSAGPTEATNEIVASKQCLDAQVGSPVTMFSYPNGGAERYYTEELGRVVRDAGFLAATTSSNGLVGSESDLFALARIPASHDLGQLAYALDAERFLLGRLSP